MADDPQLALTVCPLLEREGYRVRIAVNESQALAIVSEELPLVALSGLRAPTIFDELKRRFGHVPFPVILISDEDDLAEQAQRLYASWLPQPLQHDLLIDLIRRAASCTPCQPFTHPSA